MSVYSEQTEFEVSVGEHVFKVSMRALTVADAEKFSSELSIFSKIDAGSDFAIIKSVRPVIAATTTVTDVEGKKLNDLGLLPFKAMAQILEAFIRLNFLSATSSKQQTEQTASE